MLVVIKTYLGDAMETEKLLLTKDVAGILRVSEEYLRFLIRNKKIAAYADETFARSGAVAWQPTT